MRKAVNTVAFVVVGLGLAANARADDGKAYPGANCVEMWDTTPEIRYRTGGHAENYSTGSNTWVCPVVREVMAASMDVSDWDVVAYRASTTTAAWNINLWSTDTEGWSGYRSTVTVPAGTGYHHIDGGRINYGHAYGSVFIETTVPAYGRICSYEVTEES